MSYMIYNLIDLDLNKNLGIYKCCIFNTDIFTSSTINN